MKKTVTMQGPAGLIEVKPETVRRHRALGYEFVEEEVGTIEDPVEVDEAEDLQEELDLEDEE